MVKLNETLFAASLRIYSTEWRALVQTGVNQKITFFAEIHGWQVSGRFVRFVVRAGGSTAGKAVTCMREMTLM